MNCATIAGKGIANPIATPLTLALMLDRPDQPGTRRGPRLIAAAVETVLADSARRTVDFGGKPGTADTTTLIRQALPCMRSPSPSSSLAH